MVKPFTDIPKIIVEGRKGGSNLAATLVNSILCWPDAEQLKPGRDKSERKFTVIGISDSRGQLFSLGSHIHHKKWEGVFRREETSRDYSALASV